MNFLLEPSEVHLFSSPSYDRQDSPAQPQPRTVSPDHPALHGSLTPPVDCAPAKILNFSPGPTSLPPAVEASVRSRCFPSRSEKRLGSMALSHRSPEFSSILRRTLRATREVMEIPDEYEILFTQGGGHGQFAAVPMNLCPTGRETASYIVNGTWSQRAVEEASKYCKPHVISSLEEDGSCTAYPSIERIREEIDPDSSFLYVCSNETVNGLELHRLLPRLQCGVPLVVDASSDFTSKPIAWRESNVGLLFACASKNIGHPGITMVIVRKDLLGLANPFTPGILNYETNILADNVWNTIPTFNVDVVGIMMEWILENGGIHAMERDSIAKSDMMYDLIDNSNGFFGTRVEKETGWRSRMNVPICIADGDEALTDLFLVECWERGIVGLRTITPFKAGKYLRASLYHGVSYDETVVLCTFMKEFMARHTISKTDEVEAAPMTSLSAILAPGSPVMAAVVSPLAMLPESPNSQDSPLSPIFQQEFERFELNMQKNKHLMTIGKLSSSPDTVSDPSLTWPKNMKINQYTRLNQDMFAPPPSPPTGLNNESKEEMYAGDVPAPPALR